MESRKLSVISLTILAVLLTSTTSPRAADAEQVRAAYAYALLVPPAAGGCVAGEEASADCVPEILVRAVVNIDPKGLSNEDKNGICQGLIGGGGGTGEFRPRHNPLEEEFPVIVCEGLAIKSKEGADVRGHKVSWTAFKTDGEAAVERIVVIGDTGCRNGRNQKCEGVADASTGERPWVFDEVATAAADGDEPPGLVIHVGDYRYRDENTPDQWKYWEEDFFQSGEQVASSCALDRCAWQP
jgi:hypothetical protein